MIVVILTIKINNKKILIVFLNGKYALKQGVLVIFFVLKKNNRCRSPPFLQLKRKIGGERYYGYKTKKKKKKR